MAKIFVDIGKFSVGSVKEAAFRGSLPAVMDRAAKAAIGSKFESAKPKDGKGYRISGTLTKLEVDTKANALKGACELIVSLLPADQMKAMPKGSAKIPLAKSGKVESTDAQDLAKALIADAIEKQAIPFISKNPP